MIIDKLARRRLNLFNKVKSFHPNARPHGETWGESYTDMYPAGRLVLWYDVEIISNGKKLLSTGGLIETREDRENEMC